MTGILRRMAFLMALAVVPAGISAALCWKRGSWEAFRDHSVSLTEALGWHERVVWVDARSPADFQAAHIPKALLLNEDDWDGLLPKLLETWQPDSAIVVYCSSKKCHSSEEVARRLREEVGLKTVYVLRGGWEAWKGARP